VVGQFVGTAGCWKVVRKAEDDGRAPISFGHEWGTADAKERLVCGPAGLDRSQDITDCLVMELRQPKIRTIHSINGVTWRQWGPSRKCEKASVVSRPGGGGARDAFWFGADAATVFGRDLDVQSTGTRARAGPVWARSRRQGIGLFIPCRSTTTSASRLDGVRRANSAIPAYKSLGPADADTIRARRGEIGRRKYSHGGLHGWPKERPAN